MRMHFPVAILAAGAMVLTVANCGGGYSNPNSPGGPPASGDVGATITIRSDGSVEPAEVRIQVGQRVRFINQDTRQHQPTSNPHLSHTDCPAANLPIMSNGQNMTTGVFDTQKACGFHDHMNPDTESLRGTIRVGNADGPGGPVYVKQ
jgi:plastocyanin